MLLRDLPTALSETDPVSSSITSSSTSVTAESTPDTMFYFLKKTNITLPKLNKYQIFDSLRKVLDTYVRKNQVQYIEYLYQYFNTCISHY